MTVTAGRLHPCDRISLTTENREEKNPRLTHAVDPVVGEVALFTATLEAARDVVTFLVTSRRKVWIDTLVDVCES